MKKTNCLQVLNLLIFLVIASFAKSQSKPIPNPTSDISFALNIPLKAIEKAINDNLPELLIVDDSYTNNQNDDTKTWVYKNGNIHIQKYNETQMQLSIPLKVKVDKRWGIAGYYKNKEFEFRMKMYCLISGAISPYGDLQTQTVIQKYEYETEPELTVAGVSIPISSVVQSELDAQKSSYAQSIDAQIKEKIPLKSLLTDLLTYFSQPYKASDDYNAWIDFSCKKIQYEPFQIQNGQLHTQINLVSYLKIYMSEKPLQYTPVDYLPLVESQFLLPKQTQIHSYISIPYEMATQQLQEYIVGQTYNFQEDKYQITIDNAKITGQTDRMQITLVTQGDFEGSVSLEGYPSYDEGSKKIFVKEPKFKAKSKNVLYQTALWIKKGAIQRQIAEEYGIPVSENLDLIKQSIDQYLNTDYYNAVFLNGKTNYLQIKEIITTQYGIVLLYDLNFDLSIDIKELKNF